MKTLPEIRESCRREVQALERVIMLLNHEEKRVTGVTFWESVTRACAAGLRTGGLTRGGE